MAIHIHKGTNLHGAYLDVPVHLLPCKIHADCDSKVKQYFDTCLKQKENGVLSTSFRGHLLQGTKLDIPENYQGVVLHESIKPIVEKAERKFYVTHKFKSITYWNWDKEPSKNDLIRQAMDWIDISEALHAPVTEM